MAAPAPRETRAYRSPFSGRVRLAVLAPREALGVKASAQGGLALFALFFLAVGVDLLLQLVDAVLELAERGFGPGLTLFRLLGRDREGREHFQRLLEEGEVLLTHLLQGAEGKSPPKASCKLLRIWS